MNSIALKDVLNEIEKNCEVQEAQIKRLIEENRQLKENAKNIVDSELKNENDYLKHKLDMSVGELASEKELKAYKVFCKKHQKCLTSLRINNGKIPYVVFDVNGLGVCKKVVCQVCGEEKDITDINVW